MKTRTFAGLESAMKQAKNDNTRKDKIPYEVETTS